MSEFLCWWIIGTFCKIKLSSPLEFLIYLATESWNTLIRKLFYRLSPQLRTKLNILTRKTTNDVSVKMQFQFDLIWKQTEITCSRCFHHIWSQIWNPRAKRWISSGKMSLMKPTELKEIFKVQMFLFRISVTKM